MGEEKGGTGRKRVNEARGKGTELVGKNPLPCDADFQDKKLSYRRGTARCVVSVEILPTVQKLRVRQALIEQIEVTKLEV